MGFPWGRVKQMGPGQVIVVGLVSGLFLGGHWVLISGDGESGERVHEAE